ncbi:MAG: DEAD/DEAH box helicase family protein [Patescibacteria group bacterium]|nr:DEAD/DEAH box helicase family protein [Patescibacteria group bacterium]
MFSLKSDIEAKFGTKHGYLFCYGVMFPDISFEIESPEWDRQIIFDIRDLNLPISRYIERIVNYWRHKSSSINTEPLPKTEITDYLRPDFELATRLWSDISMIEEEITKFTNEQYRALDHMENNPRVIFSGAAGTGKTLLAIEKARRLCYEKKNTLLLCFNRLLGSKLQNETKKIGLSNEYLKTNSIHKYFYEVIEGAGLRNYFNKIKAGKKASEVYDEILPEIFAKAVEKLGNKKFDFLIIDEGQDLLNESYILALDCILQGGFKQGNWAIFLDPGGQSKLFNRFSLNEFNYLKSLGAPEYKLDQNVRNTLQIATQASIVTGFPAGKTNVEGPKVEYKMCKGITDMALQIIDLLEILQKNESVPPSSITILSSKNCGSMSIFSSGVKVPRSLLEATEDSICNMPPGKTLYASAHSYKGLENNIIIYTDLDSFDGRLSESVNYVAMTRAREKLYVFMDSKLRSKYQEKVRKFANISL